MAGGVGMRVQDFLLEVAKGNVAGHYSVNKFGRNIEIDSAVIADIWDGGHTLASGGVSLLWVAPTEARVHQLVSTSTDDDGDPAGVGAQTVQVWYLPDWDTKETSVIRTMNGTTDVALPSLVIINRMRVITKGATNSNVGVITATADTDGTVTSQIRAGVGQTEQSILGIPSTQKLFLYGLDASLTKAGGASALCDMDLLVNPEPNSELLNFVSQKPFGLMGDGSSAVDIPFHVPKAIEGAAILKMQGLSGTANVNVGAGFCGVLVDNIIGAA